MNYIKKSILGLFALLSIATIAQQTELSTPGPLEHTLYDWQETPTLDTLYNDSTENSSVYILDKQIIEYILTDSGYYSYNTKHVIVKINDDAAIEGFNKVFVPSGYNSKLIDLRARTIKADGEVINLTKKDILAMEDIDNYGSYYQFALEGVEIGSQIEYIYTLRKQDGVSYGFKYNDNAYFRKASKIHKVDFMLVSNDYLEFIYKTYNFQNGITDTTENGKRYIKVQLDTVPKYEKEEYSNYNASRYRMEFKYARFLGRTNDESNDFSDAATYFFDRYMNPDKKALKLAKKWLKKHPLKATTEEGKIKELDYLVKSNFKINEGLYMFFTPTLETAFKEGYANETAIIQVYAALYDYLGIQYYLGFTTDKTVKLFDEEFETWSFFTKTLHYFPSIDKYSAPSEKLYRVGMIPSDWEGQKGMFIRPVQMGEYKSGMMEIKDIPYSDYKKNFANMDLKVTFEDDFEEVIVDYTNKLGGVFGVGIHSIYPYYNAEERKETREEIIKGIHEDCKVIRTGVIDYDSTKSSLSNPFTVTSKVKLNSLIENAGINYLFNIGLIIGPQVELYQEKKRENDIYVHHPHTNYRTIEVEVPEGYTMEGLDKLNINVESEDKTMAFISTVKEEGNKVFVEINEYYQKTDMPKELWEEFRTVINTAADFNKITVVIKPIQ